MPSTSVLHLWSAASSGDSHGESPVDRLAFEHGIEPVGGVVAWLQVLADDDRHGLDDGALLDRTAELVRERNRIDAELARTVRVADARQACEHDGLKTMPSWLRNHTRLSAAAAAELVRSGRALEHLPALGAAFAAGDVTVDQVAAVAPIARDEHRVAAADQGVDLAEIDAALTAIAVSQPHQVLGQAVGRYLAMLDQDGPEPDPTEGRRLVLAKHADGSLSGRFDLDPVGGEPLQAALESLLQAGRCAGDDRSRSQQQADALVQLADNALASGGLPTLRGHKPQVLVKIALEDLTDPATGPGAAETGFGAAISAARARWLACEGRSP